MLAVLSWFPHLLCEHEARSCVFYARGAEEGGVATTSYAADVAGVADVTGETASSLISALLLVDALPRNVVLFSCYPLLRTIVEALRFVVFLFRYIGCVGRECMVRASLNTYRQLCPPPLT